MNFNFTLSWVKLAVLVLIVGLVWLLSSIQPLITPSFPSPQVTIANPSPCLLVDGKLTSLENLEEGTPQYICGDMTTDTSPINLTLLIYPSDNYLKSVYVTSDDFKQGTLTFIIDPPLPPGKYRALIMYARTAFADLYFDVQEK